MSSLKFLLTARGFFAFLLASALLIWVGIPYADIVASALSVIILSSLLTIATISLLRRKKIVEELQVQLSQSEDVFTAGETKPLTVLVSCGTIPFPLKVVIDITFTRGEASLPTIVVKGGGSGTTYAAPEITFPHRGVWRVSAAQARITDIAGLLSSSFPLPSLTNSAVTVHPGGTPSPNSPPIISSSYREGDTLMSHDTVEGEPYNLKRYDPSDGIRKIVWKVFARTGDLISRHIEPSVTPEGQVLVFTIAGPRDDKTCKTTLSYILELERLGLEVFFGCEGMENMPVARNSIEAQELMMDSVWFTEKGVGSVARELTEFLAQCSKSLPTSNISSIVIFTSEERLFERNFLKKDISLIREVLGSRGITPIIHLEKQAVVVSTPLSDLLFKKDAKPTSRIKPQTVQIQRAKLEEALSSWSVIDG
jgi:hypothetical protein